ncbi:MAG: PepSY domain-containing protein [Sphingobacteriales bacterium]|nr:MAG: PepSY domain-containing protein [Sphingobacteriales bacterium]TAF82684.1 MAG: PepSY domain-containing protein [Sphingobacteriales bacterium]
MEQQATNKLKKTIRKNVYKWHKYIGLITIVPVIFWCLSGLMHPFLAHWFKPQIAHEFVLPKPINKAQIKISIYDVLNQNHIFKIKNLRIVNFAGATYYQIKNTKNSWLYFNTQTGKQLPNGDVKYAEYLSRYFLADSTSSIKSISQQTTFSHEYKYINRLLPVWKVSFNRPDSIDVYVETPYSRLGTFNPTSRKVFLWIFDNFHTWSFLENISNNTYSIFIMLLLLSIISVSALSGVIIYGFMWGKFKNPKAENKKGILKKYHRKIGISVAFVSFTFAFSGGYHAIRKLTPNTLPQMVYEPSIETKNLVLDVFKLPIDWVRLSNVSIVKIKKEYFYQLFYTQTNDTDAEIIYLNTSTTKVLKNGNIEYAKFLANKFENKLLSINPTLPDCCEAVCEKPTNSLPNSLLLKAEELQKFDKREYGFAFKRLPVVGLAYNTTNKSSYYIETTTSRLAAKIQNDDRYEGYSFAIFHKFLFMDWAGKNIRDIVTMLAALGVLTVSMFGLVLFLKK